MKIFVNGAVQETEERSLEQLCLKLGYADAKVATAVNGEFVPRSLRAATRISDNDKIEILSPRQGG